MLYESDMYPQYPTPSTLGGVFLLHNKEETIGSKNQQRDLVLQ